MTSSETNRDALLSDIGAGASGTSLSLWWLGQSGFVFRWRDATVFIDPYLSEHLTAKYANTERPHVRMTEAPFRGADVRRADLILCTHKHSDHLDPGTVPDLMRQTSAKLVVPRALVEHAAAMGIDRARIIAAEPGTPVSHAGVVVHPVPSAHEQLDFSAFLGYVIRFGEFTVYHSGDCVPYDGLLDWLKPFKLDLALLPINGRDPARGVPGNFTIAEAASLASAAGARLLVPMHYDMFTFNTVDVAGFVRHMDAHHPAQAYRVMKCGERLLIH